ncbi:hypothetical protein AVEN_173518-1, partial [Araneus ventricosus]
MYTTVYFLNKLSARPTSVLLEDYCLNDPAAGFRSSRYRQVLSVALVLFGVALRRPHK